MPATPPTAQHLLPAYLLSGGRSSRFGSDKARTFLHGQPLIERLAAQLATFASSITVVADRPDKYADLNLSTIADILPGLGPLGGLATALRDAQSAGLQTGWIILTSCDLTRIEPAWIHQLASAPGDNVLAKVFRSQFWQPFPGLYHLQLLPLVEKQLATGPASFQALLNHPAAIAQPHSLPPDWPEVAQINTPQDLSRAIGGTNRSEGLK